MQSYAKIAVSMAKERGMYVVLHADGLYMIGEDISVIKHKA
jgi:ATP-dependent NAD(P)H-hydrate dehydratase